MRAYHAFKSTCSDVTLARHVPRYVDHTLSSTLRDTRVTAACTNLRRRPGFIWSVARQLGRKVANDLILMYFFTFLRLGTEHDVKHVT